MAVAEHGSVGRAAAALHMTQPPLSRQLAAMEREIGIPLLQRSVSGTGLTPAGRALAAGAVRVLESFDEAIAAARSASAPAPRAIRVGYVGNMGPHLLAPVLAAARRVSPDLVVDLRLSRREEQLEQLDAGALDVALVWGPAPAAPLRSVVVGRHPVSAAVRASHPLVGRSELGAEELVGETVLVVSHGGGVDRGAELRGRWRRAGVEPPAVRHVDNTTTGLALAAAGRGVFVAPDTMRAAAPQGVAVLPLRGWTTDMLAVAALGAAPLLDAVLDLLAEDPAATVRPGVPDRGSTPTGPR